MTKNKKNSTPVVDTTHPVAEITPAIRALIDGAVEAHRSVLDSTDTFVVRASVATYAVVEAGLIGKDQKFPTSADFGNLFPSRDGKGASASTVTRWRRLGKAHSVGITPETDAALWGFLVSKVNNFGKTFDAAATKTAIRKAAADYKREAAKPAPSATVDTTGEATVGDTATETANSTVPNSVPAMLESMESIAMALTVARPDGLTGAEAEKLASVLAILDTLTVAPLAAVV